MSPSEPQMVEVVELRGQFALLNQRLDSSITNMNATLQALQGDYRSTVDRLGVVLDELHALREKGNGIERLNTKMSDFIQASERRWETQDNKNANLSESVSNWRGAMRGGSYVGGTVFAILLALVVFIYQDDKHRLNQQIDRLEKQVLTGAR